MPPPSLSLKQKLAQLSIAQSAPSSPNLSYHRGRNGNDGYAPPTPTSPGAKRKFFSTPAWLKKATNQYGLGGDSDGQSGGGGQQTYGEEEKRMVQDALGKMIFQAGVDFETRPMVVLNASALPDPQVVSYDLLLSRILSYLDLYVEADYTVVFFAAGARHTPSWNWVWKAYRSLSRKYRKNLKQLYIIHSSFFSKMLFSLAGAIISPKFFRKIVYINSLSELAHSVPLTQIDIPPAVYQENLKYERKITMPTPIRSSIFGVPLEDLMGYNGEKGGVPRVVRDAAQFLRDTGMKEEGLFRRSPSSALLRAAQDAYDRGNTVSLETFGDPHIAAVLLKKYLRDLPEPIFSEATYPIIRRCPMPLGEADPEAESSCIHYIREVIFPELVPCAYILLSYILHLLHDVSLRSDFNRMDPFNLAIVVCPNLVKSLNPVRDVMMCSVPVPTAVTGMSAGSLSNSFMSQEPNTPTQNSNAEGKTTLGLVIAFCIKHYYEVFDEIVDRSEAVAPWRTLGQGENAEDVDGMYVLGDDDDLDDEASMGQRSSSVVGQSSRHAHGTKRHRNTMSRESNNPSITARSLYTSNDAQPSGGVGSPSAWHNARSTAPSQPPTAFATNGKAKSMISIEGAGAGSGPLGSGTMRRGSIAIGRGTTRKGSGAAVEAVGVTAEGFFSPPGGGGAPPVPKMPSSPPTSPTLPTSPTSLKSPGLTPTAHTYAGASAAKAMGAASGKPGEEAELEERVLSVGERRRMFEGGQA